jgi:PTS system, lactose/cellobiose family IIC component
MSKFFDSKFAKSLQKFGEKLGSNKSLSAISGGLMGTMGLMLVGAIFQILATLLALFNVIENGGAVYNILLAPYNMTMGIISLIVAFAIAYGMAKAIKINPLSAGINSLVIFLLIAAPAKTVILADGVSTMTVMDTSFLGGTGLFTAILVGLISVRVTKFCEDKNIVIKMPDVVPAFLANAFSAMIPLFINVILFYGINLLLTSTLGMALPLAITVILSIPFQAVSTLGGMIILGMFCTLMWTFGIHGTMIGFMILMPLLMQAILGNAELVAAGQQPVFNPVLLFTSIAMLGGTGNTLAISILGLRSKSEQIKAVAKASIVPAIFNINEPVIFGFPVMYNPILAIPYILNPIVVMLLGYFGYMIGFLKPAYIMFMSLMPIGVSEFFGTMAWQNVVFVFLMIPVTMVIWFPFYKVYERQLIEKEAAAKAAETV